jgi:hypothetical protein
LPLPDANARRGVPRALAAVRADVLPIGTNWLDMIPMCAGASNAGCGCKVIERQL